MFSDPFGLCPEQLRDAEGKCPGGLSVGQWNKVEEAAIFHLDGDAQNRVLGLLDAGKIHSGLGLGDKFAAWVQGTDLPAASTNRLTGSVNVADGTWDYESGELAFVLAHESEHTVQSVFKGTKASERGADAYACANTRVEERGGYANGGYPELGGCKN